jgi:CheY-like chemotaxis protein
MTGRHRALKAEDPPPPKEPLRILLVDDNEDVCEIYGQFLRFKGVGVTCVVEAAKAISIAASDPPDLVVMDLHMPGMDGWEATRRLKAQPETASIPVLVLSADVFPDARHRADEVGADAYCAKPCEPNELLGQIHRTLAAVRSRRKEP